MSQIGLLLRLYIRPLQTFSRILDEGRLLFAALAAVGVLLAIQIPRAEEYRRNEIQTLMKARAERAAQRAKQPAPATAGPEDSEREPDMELLLAVMDSTGKLPNQAADRFVGLTPKQYLAPLAAMAVCLYRSSC